MMNDEDLEATLRRYRVVDPPPRLPEIVAAAAQSATGERDIAWWWGPAAAAAVFAVWVGAHVATREPVRDPVRDAEVAFIADELGGGEDAVRYAELAVPSRRVDDRLVPPMEEPW